MAEHLPERGSSFSPSRHFSADRHRGPRLPLMVWVLAVLSLAGGAMMMRAGDRIAAAPASPGAAPDASPLWMGIILVALAFMLTLGSVVISLVRPATRWAGVVGLVSAGLGAAALFIDPLGRAAGLIPVLGWAAAAGFLAYTVLLVLAARRHSRPREAPRPTPTP